ncbi:MAG: VOC family protein [Gemmatimonadaceae bacterium]|jgi:methylmalonyl-CoA/ethylmalonyl-CoA epimerase|nr:VOC family protein [Gemmatimonadaceae bacterium]
MSTAVVPHRLGQVAITVQDVARATAWYRDVLGLTHLFNAPPGLAFFDIGGVRLMLARPEGESGGTSVLYYAAIDLAGIFTRFADHGATIVQQPHKVAAMPDHDLWIGFVRDSEGNLVGVMSEVPRAPAA